MSEVGLSSTEEARVQHAADEAFRVLTGNEDELPPLGTLFSESLRQATLAKRPCIRWRLLFSWVCCWRDADRASPEARKLRTSGTQSSMSSCSAGDGISASSGTVTHQGPGGVTPAWT